MTLDEAIEHAEEVANKKEREKQKWERWLETDSDFRAVTEKVSCELCAKEHRQLAEWLKELKRQREAWEKTRAEIENKIFCKNASNYDLGLCRALDVIDKHLREVTTDANRD